MSDPKDVTWGSGSDSPVIGVYPHYRERFVGERPTGPFRVVRDEWTELDAEVPLRTVLEWEAVTRAG